MKEIQSPSDQEASASSINATAYYEDQASDLFVNTHKDDLVVERDLLEGVGRNGVVQLA